MPTPEPAPSASGRRRDRAEWIAVGIGIAVFAVIMPGLNMLDPGSPLHVSNFTLNLFGKFLCYAILALGLDLLWGYAGVLSLGHGVFFGLGAYAMGMHLMRSEERRVGKECRL